MLDLSLPEQLPHHKAITQEEKNFIEEKNETPIAFKPTEGDLKKFIQEIKKTFPTIYEWKDFSHIMVESLKYLEKFFDLTLSEKRQNVFLIMHFFVSTVDQVNLPKEFKPSIFYPMATAFIDMLVPNNVEELLSKLPCLKMPEEIEIVTYAQSIKTAFGDGFQWKDFATATRLSIRYASRFTKMDVEQKQMIAKQVMDYIIDSTDTYYLPTYISDIIFKELCHSFINELFEIISN